MTNICIQALQDILLAQNIYLPCAVLDPHRVVGVAQEQLHCKDMCFV